MKSFIRFIAVAVGLLAMFDAQSEPARVLPLDHGPRAQSTPWVNAQIREREAREAQKAQKAQRPPEAATEPAPVAPVHG